MIKVKVLLHVLFSLTFMPGSGLFAAESEEHFKLLGNKAYERKDYALAIALYSESLLKDPQNICFRNRGIAFAALKNFSSARTDFNEALKRNPADAKSHYWLGRISLEQKKITEAIYHLENALKENQNSQQIISLLQQARDEFAGLLSILAKYQQKPLSLSYFEKIISNQQAIGEKLGIKNMKRAAYFCALNRTLHGEVPGQLARHWIIEHYLPLNLEELPFELADFIGSGTRIATVIVQTMPIYLAKNFKQVSAYDISRPQIIFQNNMRRAMQEGTLEQFVEKAQKDFSDFAAMKSKSPDINDQIKYMFKRTYEPLYDKYYDNISLKEQDIFKAVDAETSDRPHDVVFLSTIPVLYFQDWPKTYRAIYSWLSKGKTVVYSLLTDSFIDESIYNELIFAFDELADLKTTMFEQSAPMIHIKLMPKH